MEVVAHFRNLLSGVLPNPPSNYLLLQWPLSAALVPWTTGHDRSGPGAASSCPKPQLSCHNSSAVTDTCCFNYPGGQFLQTQFCKDPSKHVSYVAHEDPFPVKSTQTRLGQLQLDH